MCILELTKIYMEVRKKFFCDAEFEDVDNDEFKQSPSVTKREKRTEYNNMFKKKQRQDPAFKANEMR